MEYIQTEYASDEEPNLCMECGIDLGPMNPRQLCGKWRCLNEAMIDDKTTTADDLATYNEEPERKKPNTNDK